MAADMKLSPLWLLLLVFPFSGSPAAVMHDPDAPPEVFAAQALEDVLTAQGIAGCEIRFITERSLGEQSYRIERTDSGYTVAGGDAAGVMYGGLELAERLSLGGDWAGFSSISGTPHIKRRGLKMNIPLDIRTPSYQDAGDAAQANIAEMWNWDFWTQYLDTMALHRYNVLTLWNPHPFPSMIRLEEYPDIALEDVCGTSFPLDTDRPDEPVAKFIAGCGVSQEVMDNLIILKRMTMEEKIAFWQRVTRYARERGIDIYFITWNVKLNSVAPPGWYREQKLKMGDKGKYGINNDQENPRTIEYLRKCTTEFLRTYPDIKGIGITAGENMEDRDDAYDREKWLWATYGEGIMDYKKLDPRREIGFIHRVWQSGMPKIMEDFVEKYPDEIDFSFKYARARMYATTDPPWSNEFQDEIAALGMKSWWNIRNDDIFHFRWGDPEYVRSFILNLPPEELTAGFYMGSDSYVWGREFISQWPNTPRDLEISQHWYNFMLWGRMGVDPDLPPGPVQAMVQQRFPEAPAVDLVEAWASASAIVPLVNRFHWRSWDFMWAVEGCLDLRKGFHDVNDFIGMPPMEGSGIASIPDYVNHMLSGSEASATSPLSVAEQLDSHADQALAFVRDYRNSDSIPAKEFSELLYDIEAMSYLGRYYADKIRGAVELQSYRMSGGPEHKDAAVCWLLQAEQEWEAYAAAATANYQPQFLSKTRVIDWWALLEDVRHDTDIARQAQPLPDIPFVP